MNIQWNVFYVSGTYISIIICPQCMPATHIMPTHIADTLCCYNILKHNGGLHHVCICRCQRLLFLVLLISPRTYRCLLLILSGASVNSDSVGMKCLSFLFFLYNFLYFYFCYSSTLLYFLLSSLLSYSFILFMISTLDTIPYHFYTLYEFILYLSNAFSIELLIFHFSYNCNSIK